MYEAVTDELRELLNEAVPRGDRVIQNAITALENQAELLGMMQEFVSQYREEFEENLSYEQQELYRAYFELEAERDPFSELREMGDFDGDEDEDSFGFGNYDRN